MPGSAWFRKLKKVDQKFYFSVSDRKRRLVPCLVLLGSTWFHAAALSVLEYNLAWFRAWFSLVPKVDKSRQEVVVFSFRSQEAPGSVLGSAWFHLVPCGGIVSFRIQISLVPCLVEPGSESRQEVVVFSFRSQKAPGSVLGSAWFHLVPCGGIVSFRIQSSLVPCLVQPGSESRQEVVVLSFRSQKALGSVPGSAWFHLVPCTGTISFK